ncbi:hypothetical protein ACFY97_18510 [Streptomyces klenkii]|uniref:hypothetical protein n=1 Tax=Streptomyces klenkii TaxID=1420899 RepID=UPI0036E2860E
MPTRIQRRRGPLGLVAGDGAHTEPIPAPWPTAVICGSTRHMDRLRAAAETCTLLGYAVHMPHLTVVDAETVEVLARMWRSLIAHADLVVIVPKPDDSLGQATAGEKAYAEELGKDIREFEAETGLLL